MKQLIKLGLLLTIILTLFPKITSAANCVASFGTSTFGKSQFGTNGSSVNCTTNTYTIGGTVSGLANGQSVVLQNNLGDNKTVSGNESFTFATPLNYGSSYSVTVLTQPTGQTCSVSNGSGTVTTNTSNVSVNCTTNTYIPGDVNGDGRVDALDVVAVINAVLGIQPSSAADVNNDGAVNALDVVFVINRVLDLPR